METVLALLGRAADTDVIENVLRIVLVNAIASSENEASKTNLETINITPALDAERVDTEINESNTSNSNTNSSDLQTAEGVVDIETSNHSTEDPSSTPDIRKLQEEQEADEFEEKSGGNDIPAGVAWFQLMSTEVSQISLTLRFAERTLVQGIVNYLQQQQNAPQKHVQVPDELVAFYQRHI